MSVGRTASWSRRRDLLQDLVAGGVAEAVVDGLEVVEVDEHDGDVGDPRSARTSACSTRSENSARLASFGHRVVERLVRELVLERLALADVAAVEDDAADVLVVEQVGVLDLEPQRRAVAVLEVSTRTCARPSCRRRRPMPISCASRGRSLSLRSRSKRVPSTSSAR